MEGVAYSTTPPVASTTTTTTATSLSPTGIHSVPIDTLASQSDILFILTPGGPSTHHLINEPFLKKMKPTSVLINVARGTIVDSDALVKALREKWIWAAGLDVVEGEPNVGIDHPLVREPRAIVLPHIGSATFNTRNAMAELAARNLIAGLEGQELLTELPLSFE
jgi:glyoxylate/hydroxypyruvate reductase